MMCKEESLQLETWPQELMTPERPRRTDPVENTRDKTGDGESQAVVDVAKSSVRRTAQSAGHSPSRFNVFDRKQRIERTCLKQEQWDEVKDWEQTDKQLEQGVIRSNYHIRSWTLDSLLDPSLTLGYVP